MAWICSASFYFPMVDCSGPLRGLLAWVCKRSWLGATRPKTGSTKKVFLNTINAWKALLLHVFTRQNMQQPPLCCSALGFQACTIDHEGHALLHQATSSLNSLSCLYVMLGVNLSAACVQGRLLNSRKRPAKWALSCIDLHCMSA